jgi:hypothetical protein
MLYLHCVCDGVTATVAQGYCVVEYDWEITRQREASRYGGFTLKTENEIAGLTMHRDQLQHSSTRLF